MESNRIVERFRRQGVTVRNFVAMPVVFLFVFLMASGFSAVVSMDVDAVTKAPEVEESSE